MDVQQELHPQVHTSAYPLLSCINSPKDLQALSKDKLVELEKEIRAFLIDHVTLNGGHLASNLGVVELTMAIHRVFDSPTDHIIFDVGHQCYVHKILTGRRDGFDTLRTIQGISGFPKRSESEYDAFGTGHSSTSLSAALGFAEADRLRGSNAYTVCVLGDGAYTGGMIHEALNNCKKRLRLIIVLNENEMSISKNLGRFAKDLSKLRSKRGYIKTKNVFANMVGHIPLIGKPIVRFLKKIKDGFKAALYGSNYFENLGLAYFGPIDGNNEERVETILREAKLTGQSCVVHVKTKKGKGYLPAEQTPTLYHGISPESSEHKKAKNFSHEMGEILCNIAEKNEKVCAITAAMTEGTGLEKFRDNYRNRFFDVGIAEEHAITFAAGLAANGMRPVFAVYSTFLQRSYDQLIHDVALQNLSIVLCIDRAGLNCKDGPTHYGIYDVSFLSQISNTRIYTPVTFDGLKLSLYDAMKYSGITAVRYPNSVENEMVLQRFYPTPANTIGIRKDFDSSEPMDAIIVTYGRIVEEAMKAADSCKEKGKKVGILLLELLGPYEDIAKSIVELLPMQYNKIILLEEGILQGGCCMYLAQYLRKIANIQNKPISLMAIDKESIHRKITQDSLYKAMKIDAENIISEIEKG